MAISLPVRDANGLAIPHDHAEILPEHQIIRRISTAMASECLVVGKNGNQRLSSAIFTPSSPEQDPYEGLSVDLECVAISEGVNLPDVILAEKFLGAISIECARLREEQARVGYDPEPNNVCHGQAWGKFGNKMRKRLLKHISWFVQIDGVGLRDE